MGSQRSPFSMGEVSSRQRLWREERGERMVAECFFCESRTELTVCERCDEGLHYCPLHVGSHHTTTGHTCYPWRVESRQGVGRLAVASRDISCHQLVLEDRPLGLSPTQDSPLACLTCNSLLQPQTAVLCECGYMMCSEACCQHPTHQPEHKLFVSAGARQGDIQGHPTLGGLCRRYKGFD